MRIQMFETKGSDLSDWTSIHGNPQIAIIGHLETPPSELWHTWKGFSWLGFLLQKMIGFLSGSQKVNHSP